MFYIVSKDLPTTATCTSMSRAYAFRNMLLRLGYQAEVKKVERVLTK